MENNKRIISMLEELANIMQRRGDGIRAKAYENAATQIMLLKKDITNPKQLVKDVPGIGKTIAEKIDTFLKTGTLEILERERVNPFNIFTQIYGVGPKKAEQLITNNITTISQVKENLHLLNDKQKVGVKYYEDILQRIPRSEIDDFYVKLTLIFEELDIKGSRFEICGSYRREHTDSGDIDVIITNDYNDSTIFTELLDWLKTEKYIVKDGFLTRGDVKSLTIMDIYPEHENSLKRRVDFFYTPPNEYAFALLYFTGSKIFNTLMRQRAQDMGYTLNEHGISYLEDDTKGKKVEMEFPDEKSIFKFLNMKYKRPSERTDFTAIEDYLEQPKIKHNKTVKRIKVVKPDYIEKFKNEGATVLDTMTKEELIDLIKTLNQYYYIGSEESKKSLVSDNQYDIIKEYIEKKYPDINSDTISHTSTNVKRVERNKVKLPYELWSMDKIKPDTDSVKKWIKKYNGPYVVSCKLDGISALYVSGESSSESKLYTRGNGREGQDISHLIPYIIWKNKSLNDFETDFVLRGEIIIKSQVFEEKYKDTFANPRNFVAGIVNKKTLDANLLIDLDFVPYEVIKPQLKPSDQFKFIKDEWISNPVQYKIMENINNDNLSQTLLEWRDTYEYEIDGIIVVDDNIYERPSKNPDYAFAFKMVISDKIAEAKVLDVIWTPSKDGYLKPRIRIEPIKLDGVVIEYATGFNAQFIDENKIGVGSLITIRRSGKVIPHIVNVVEPAEKSMMPNLNYTWTESGVDIVLVDSEYDKIVKQKNILGFFRGIGVDGIGPGNIKRIIDSGFDSVPKIIAMTKDDFLKVEGFKEKTAEKLFNSINDKISKSKIYTLMAASNLFGRGFGETRFQAILNMYPDILTSTLTNSEKIKLLENVDGIAKLTAKRFVDSISKFNEFMNNAGLEHILYNVVSVKDSDSKQHSDSKKDSELSGKKIVMTGFRNKELSEKLKKIGAIVSESVNKNVFVVLVKNKDEDTTKAELARQNNIPLMLVDDFIKKYKLDL